MKLKDWNKERVYGHYRHNIGDPKDLHAIGTCKDCKHWEGTVLMWSGGNLEHRVCNKIDRYIASADQRFGSVPREDFGCVHWEMKKEAYRCDGCELELDFEDLMSTGGSEIYCKLCFDDAVRDWNQIKEKEEEEQKEIIEKTAYDTYKLIDLANQGMLSDSDNDYYARYNLTEFYQLCVNWMDDELREQLHGSDGLDTDAKFLKAYCEVHEKEFKHDFYVNYL